jgi:sigma-E factor negative regulatory protein RseB
MKFALTAAFFFLFSTRELYCSDYNVSIRISVNGQNYIEDVIKDFSSIRNKVQFLALKLMDTTFELEDIEDNFYQINVINDIKVLNKKIKIYRITSLFGDRFSHIIWVYKKNILRREVYDLNNKLLYAYGFNNIVTNNRGKLIRLKNLNNIHNIPMNYYKGFVAVYKKYMDKNSQILYSDGLNKFSIFIKQDGRQLPESKEVLFGNYVYRYSKNSTYYVIIGTIPHNEMKRFLSLYIKGGNYEGF